MKKYTRSQHEKFLKKMGVHPTQLKKRKKNKWDYSLKVKGGVSLSDKIPENGTKSITTNQFVSDTHTVMIAYNKGNYQVVNKDEIKYAGKKW